MRRRGRTTTLTGRRTGRTTTLTDGHGHRGRGLFRQLVKTVRSHGSVHKQLNGVAVRHGQTVRRTRGLTRGGQIIVRGLGSTASHLNRSFRRVGRLRTSCTESGARLTRTCRTVSFRRHTDLPSPLQRLLSRLRRSCAKMKR